MTFSELKTLVYDLLRQSSTNTEYTETLVASMLNISHKEIVRDTKCYMLPKEQTLTASTYILDASDIVTTDTEIDSIHSAVYKNASTKQKQPLEQRPYENVEAMFSDTDTPDNETNLYYFGYRDTTTDTMCFYPSPTNNTTISVNAYVVPTNDMSGASDTPTGIPASFQSLVAYLAVYKILLSESEGNALGFYQTFVLPNMERLEQWARINYPMVSENISYV